ncbi:MAG: PilZ domain-containing protein [Desulfobacterales bacterium]|nr:MAG: PilZ domain-containing protein [Desulfobacterales bacterium]
MKDRPERRNSKRLNHKDTVMLTDESSDFYCYGQLINLSGGGMYFETECNMKPGKEINIRFENPPFRSAPKNYLATVQWCRRLSDFDSIGTYGVGVMYS